jgi:hypothetical protein
MVINPKTVDLESDPPPKCKKVSEQERRVAEPPGGFHIITRQHQRSRLADKTFLGGR